MSAYRVRDEVLSQVLDGEVVVLDTEAERYYSLNHVGAAVWGSLSSGATPEVVVSRLMDDFDVDEATARADVRELIDELVAAGLIEAVG